MAGEREKVLECPVTSVSSVNTCDSYDRFVCTSKSMLSVHAIGNTLTVS